MILTLATIIFFLVCVLLIFMVVITPSQEGGLASAFGGMGADSFFGTKAGRHINRFTVFLAVTFLVLAMLINWLHVHERSVDGTFVPEKKTEQPEPAPKPEGGEKK